MSKFNLKYDLVWLTEEIPNIHSFNVNKDMKPDDSLSLANDKCLTF